MGIGKKSDIRVCLRSRIKEANWEDRKYSVTVNAEIKHNYTRKEKTMKMIKSEEKGNQTTIAYIFTPNGYAITDYVGNQVITRLREDADVEGTIIVMQSNDNNDPKAFLEKMEKHYASGDAIAIFSASQQEDGQFVMKPVSSGDRTYSDMIYIAIEMVLAEIGDDTMPTNEIVDSIADLIQESFSRE